MTGIDIDQPKPSKHNENAVAFHKNLHRKVVDFFINPALCSPRFPLGEAAFLVS